MKKIPLLFLLLFVSSFLFSQKKTSRVVLKITPQDQTLLGTIPDIQAQPFLAFSMKWIGENKDLAIRFSTDKQHWENWKPIKRGEDTNMESNYTISDLFFENKSTQYFHLSGLEGIENLELHFYNPGKSEAPSEITSTDGEKDGGCNCEQPSYLNRSQWCPSGTCYPHPNPSQTTVSHLIIHHSATSNTSSDWAAVVRSFWDWHVNNNGWSDIGYNWLVDPNGVVYEGRGDDILGAHFCGTNTGTMGVCVIGDFTSTIPTSEARNSLKKLLAWKTCKSDIDPLGQSYHSSSGLNLKNISGHRNGCSTACPGDQFYPLLGEVRQEVRTYIDTVCNVVAVHPLLNAEELKVYPNPAGEKLFIELENGFQGNVDINIFNTLAQQSLKSYSFEKMTEREKFELDVKALLPGIYLIQLKQGQEIGLVRMLKQ